MATFDDNRDSMLEDLFSNNQEQNLTDPSRLRKEGLRQKFMRLERLKKQELSRWWDATVLRKYIDKEQVPRGYVYLSFLPLRT